MLALLVLLQLTQSAPAAEPARPGVDGKGAPTVTIPRVETAVSVDGNLDEDVWSRASRLTGFSQYQPVDGRPAEEETEVLVWYSPTAIHFGIIAHDTQPGTLRATVADRDNLSYEDTVTVYLDTFGDKRRAFFFTVNPLGMQEDGVRTEGAFNAGTMYGGNTDKNPDYQWDSKGRVTDEGFVVEVRIPFKSLRYPGGGPQRWGVNVERKVQRTGYRDTWTDVKRASSSYLAQAGGIDGLHDMKRGLVTEVQPFVTAVGNGAVDSNGTFSRDDTDFNPGVNLRLGMTNLSVDATVNPDFSQVESDASQVTANERYALYYAEKRPFFLEGIELFSTPNQLVYSRQIVNPMVGGKVTGKFGKTNVALLTVKEKDSAGGALFNIARIRRDLGSDSTAGVTYTDRTATGEYNRVLAADARIVFKKLYYVQAQVGRAWTDLPADSTSSGLSGSYSAPVWLAEFDRTGRAWGFNYKLTGFGKNFVTQSGYVPRSNIVDLSASNRLSLYGKRGAFVEQFTFFAGPDRIWRYGDFGHEGALEGKDGGHLTFSLRGGWSVTGSLDRQFYRFDPEDYEDYQVNGVSAVEAFNLPEEVSGLWGRSIRVTTPTFQIFNVSLEVEQGDVAIFDEASKGKETSVSTTIGIRPTPSIRIEQTNEYSRITRASNDSEFARTVIPRLKVEYQPTRALFFRVVGEYQSERQAVLYDPWTGTRPIIVGGNLSTASRSDGLRLDFLFSYEPTPGTVAFFGYGSSMATERTLSLHGLQRQSDGFFVKLAYQFRK